MASQLLSSTGIEVYPSPGPSALAAELELERAGVPVPMVYRQEWLRLDRKTIGWLLLARGADGLPTAAAGVDARPSRSLPGHLLLRTERFGESGSRQDQEALLRAIQRLARRSPRVIRLYLEIFSCDGRIDETAALAAGMGFRASPAPRPYGTTSLIDLRPTEEDLLGGFSPTARRHIRAVAKHPVEIRPISDPSLQGRMRKLLDETMARTGGRSESTDWGAIVRLSEQRPDLSRLVGLFRTDRTGPEALLAFVWAQNHGSTVEYSTAASTRQTELKLPMAYGLAWDVIRWAKQRGARLFDFGGISPGSHSDGQDHLGGISDFKRYFSGNEQQVGAEWIYEPAPIRAAVARAVSAGTTRLANLR